MFGVFGQRRYAFALPPLVIGLLLLVWQARAENGGLELALGSRAWLFWLSVVAWTACTALTIRRTRWGWLLLLTAPITQRDLGEHLPDRRLRWRKLPLTGAARQCSQSSTGHPFAAASLRSGPCALTANGSSAHSSTGASETWSL